MEYILYYGYSLSMDDVIDSSVEVLQLGAGTLPTVLVHCSLPLAASETGF